MLSWMPLSYLGEADASIARLKELLHDMPFEDALFFTCLLNAITSNEEIPQHKVRQEEAVRLLTLSKTKAMVDKYLQSQTFPFVLSRRHLLELMKWIAAYANGTGQMINSDNLLIAAINAADLSATRHDHLLDANDKANSEERMRKATPAIREMALWGSPGWFPLHSLGRAQLILADRFFTKDKFKQAFETNAKLSVTEFIVCMAGVATLGLGAMDPDTGKRRYGFTAENVWAKAGNFRAVFDKFFNRFSLSSDELREELKRKDPREFCDFKFLRNKPIVRFNDGTYLIPDPVIFAQCLSAGPIFQIISVGANEVFGGFGDAFEDYSEEVVSAFHGRLEESGIKNGRLSFNRKLALNVNESRELSDITLSTKHALLLIETKGVWLKDEVLESLDSAVFWTEVNSKYGVAQKPGERNKGFAQLADSIKALADGAPLEILACEAASVRDEIIPPSVDTIYPVLLVHDALLNASGWIPHLISEDFARMLGQKEASRTGFFQYTGKSKTFRIANLIVMAIQDLERIVSAKEEKSLFNHIEEYAAEDALRLMVTFDMYAQNTGQVVHEWSPIMRPSQEMMKLAGDILMGRHDVGTGNHDLVARKAYYLWINKGRMNGHDLEDWFDAERELVSLRVGEKADHSVS